MKRLFFAIFFFLMALCGYSQNWTCTWATATEYMGDNDIPQDGTLSHCAVRQTIHISLGGEKMRLRLSNTFCHQPLDIQSVYVAEVGEGAAIAPKSARYLSFNGKKNVRIESGETVVSDVLKYSLKPLQRLSVTINYGEAVPLHPTGHRGSRTTSFIMHGESKPKSSFVVDEKIERWFSIDALDVETDGPVDCIAVLGNSITDGRGTTTDMQNRWTDVLAEGLGGQCAVLNLGIGGNCVLSGGLGQPATERFERDIMSQHGVTHLIIFEGINDIGGTKNSEQTSGQLIRAYEKFISQARQHGMKVYLGTITPLGKTDYWSFFHEAARQAVNEWIRSNDKVEGILDFDLLLRDPQEPTQLTPQWQYDGLHPNAEGYRVMGNYAAEQLR